jgi:glycosyltransferase involved in cell wall biosynthesis
MHVVPHMDDEASGPSQSVLRLCEELANLGDATSLHTVAIARPPIGVELFIHDEWVLPRRFGFSLKLLPALAKAARQADIVHNHSLWSFPNMAAGIVCSGSAARLITSPRGTLANPSRARSGLKKKLFKPLQWPAVTQAACLHATSKMELSDIREIGLRQPVAVVPNGIDIPLLNDGEIDDTQAHRRRLLFLGRLHPIKGVEFLLKAWRRLQSKNSDWELVIAGKGESAYVDSLRGLAASLRLDRIEFVGPVFQEEKRRLYRSSELFVLPTHTENFGMAIAEAQAHSIPVVTTQGAPWAGLLSHGSGWWIEQTVDSIEAALCEAMQFDQEQLREMGMRGREWMINDFAWPSIARQMKAVYRWVCEGGEKPAWIDV